MTYRHVAVIDIGKTNAKLALVDTHDLTEIAVLTRPNTVRSGPPYPHFDVDAIWAFLLNGLSMFHLAHRVDAISITTHGAACAFLASDGKLAAPIMDYEFDGPDELAADYNAVRPEFAETGSPRLPFGLNLGAQVHWQLVQDPSLLDRTKHILTYPQYWGHRLTGEFACDLSSLGCHTDLWKPFAERFSTLVTRLGIESKIARPRKSTDKLGAVLPEIAARCDLRPDTPVFCGIHDSNASLLPHILRREPPFSVVSTGTWVIAMTIGGAEVSLDPARDTLVNVSGLGTPVPSARFMGGREFDLMTSGDKTNCSPAAMQAVAENGPYILPAVVPESGPFPNRTHNWLGPEPAKGSPERFAAVGFYLAMMTAECLSLTGHRGHIVLEGPFVKNAPFCELLTAATACPVWVTKGETGTSQGAALLSIGSDDLHQYAEPSLFAATPTSHLRSYAERWKHAL